MKMWDEKTNKHVSEGRGTRGTRLCQDPGPESKQAWRTPRSNSINGTRKLTAIMIIDILFLWFMSSGRSVIILVVHHLLVKKSDVAQV
jgi:hypothetical protein